MPLSTSDEIDMKIAVKNIRIDGGTQSRASLNQQAIGAYREAYSLGKQMPPLEVIYDGKNYWLWDGFHRLMAQKQEEFEEVECNVEQGTQRDAILKSVGANANHGLQRTYEDRCRAVTCLLMDPEWCAKSDRWIAETANVNNHLVGSLRSSLNLQPIDGVVETKDGRKRKVGKQHDEPVSQDLPDNIPLDNDIPEDAKPLVPSMAVAQPVIPPREPPPSTPEPKQESELEIVTRQFDVVVEACKDAMAAYQDGLKIRGVSEHLSPVSGEIEKRLKSVIATLAVYRPACYCKTCSGQGCDDCRQSGWLPKCVADRLGE